MNYHFIYSDLEIFWWGLTRICENPIFFCTIIATLIALTVFLTAYIWPYLWNRKWRVWRASFPSLAMGAAFYIVFISSMLSYIGLRDSSDAPLITEACEIRDLNSTEYRDIRHMVYDLCDERAREHLFAPHTNLHSDYLLNLPKRHLPPLISPTIEENILKQGMAAAQERINSARLHSFYYALVALLCLLVIICLASLRDISIRTSRTLSDPSSDEYDFDN